MQAKTLTADQAAQKLITSSMQVVDIRDPASFSQGRIKAAIHLDNSSIANFLATSNKDIPVLVCCYSGGASRGVALYLEEQGYKEAYSLDGGFSYWQLTQPDLCE